MFILVGRRLPENQQAWILVLNVGPQATPPLWVSFLTCKIWIYTQ